MQNFKNAQVLVIIVTYNAMQWAEKCLGSIHASTVVPDVFVIDNGSMDGTQAFIKELYPKVIFHQSEENIGFGKANNVGLQYALDHNYDYVYLLNQDAWIMPDTLEQLIALSEKYSDYGILSPFQMNADMEHIDHNFLANVLAWKSNPDIVNDIYQQKLKDLYPVGSVMAAHWFMTRECIMKVGGFSPSFPHYSEDDNYTDRVHFRGLKVGVVPSLRVVHDRGGRIDSLEKKMYLGYTSSIRRLSSPLNSMLLSYCENIYYIFKDVVLCRTFRPVLYSWKLLLKLPQIVRNRKLSINDECAFLK